MAALKAPPKVPVERTYTLDEVKADPKLSEFMAGVEVKSISFDFDSSEVEGEKVPALGNLGAAVQQILKERPKEVFFIEGHADAPGTETYNLALSKKRAMIIRKALINGFGVPADNIIVAGYGEQNLKVQDSGPREENRRVAIRCLSPLLENKTAAQ